MSVPLTQLFQALPDDTEHRINTARKQWNKAVRETLRQETGLRLKATGSAATSPDQQSQEYVAVRVRLVAGLPTALEKMQLSEEEAAVMLIGRWRPTLEALLKGVDDVTKMREELQAQAGRQRQPYPRAVSLLEQGGQPELASLEVWVRYLLDLLKTHDPLKKLLAVEEEVLGVYRYPGPSRIDYQDRDLTGLVSIELYWALIGLTALSLGVSVEALTVVVLAHELGHAYVHVGRDIDGYRWLTPAMAASGRPLLEGLAQYYTERVCQRLIGKSMAPWRAYEKLLGYQPPPYNTHRDSGWTKDYQPEQVRLALLETRRRAGQAGLDTFREALDKSTQRLPSIAE